MRNTLLPRLALRGLYGNRRLYLPFVLATAFMAMLYFVIAAFCHNPSFGQAIPKGGQMQMLMAVGYYLLPVVLVPFLFYIYSYLLKTRSRELALYAVLGLQKRHIAVVLLIENAVCLLVCLLLGIGAGAVLCPLVTDGLLAMLHIQADLVWPFPTNAIIATTKVFAFCFAVLLVLGVWRAARTRPATLLREQTQGEKPMRAKPLLALVGTLCLLAGYWLSVFSTLGNLVSRFMLALLLVIIGTYGVFTAGSAFLLEHLRKRPRFWRDPAQFVTVSGLQHRMRKNAAGLTNLCLFCSAALFTLCCACCVLIGQGDALSVLGVPMADGQVGLNTAALTRQDIALEFTTLAFLGVFFVLVFVACAALVLYYKQLAEGLDDAPRFRILCAAGLSEEMAVRTARRQMRAVLLLPLLGALTHIAFASPLIALFLSLLAISSPVVLAGGFALAAVLFVLLYLAGYRLASKAYLRAIL